MSTQDHRRERVPIRQLPTGVPGLDEILGGRLPEYSFNIIAGAPGSGKTTLAHLVCTPNSEQSVRSESGYFRSLIRRCGDGTEGNVDGGDHRLLA